MNKLKKLFKLSGLFVTIFTLNSCSWLECEAQEIILVRNYQHSAALQSNPDKPLRTFNEIFEQIKSPEIINSVIYKMNLNQEYKKYLSNTNLTNKFKLKSLKNSDYNVLTLSYIHSDTDFANAMVNTWVDIVNQEIRDKYKPKGVSLEPMYKDSYSDQTINNIIANLNKNKKYQNYLASDKFIQYFAVTRHHNPDTITVKFEHPYIKFSNEIIDTWTDVMSKKYDYFTWFSEFTHQENISDTGLKSIEIGIANEYIDYITILKSPNDETCSKPDYLVFD
ncbi:MAG: hypothetical protein AAF383_07110 [Cyanobacteria bacterium P01_A01_bin.83]